MSLARMAQVASAPTTRRPPSQGVVGSGYRIDVEPDYDADGIVNAWVHPLDGHSPSAGELRYVHDVLQEVGPVAEFPVDNVRVLWADEARASGTSGSLRTMSETGGGATALTLPPKDAEAAGAGRESPVTTGLQRIAAYIPTEVLATYIALIGLTAPDPARKADLTLKWVLFGGGIFMIVAYLLLTYLLKNKSQREEAAAEARQKKLFVDDLRVAGEVVRYQEQHSDKGAGSRPGASSTSTTAAPLDAASQPASSSAAQPKRGRRPVPRELKERRRKFEWTLAFGLVGFTVYAMAIPASPFAKFTTHLGMWGGGLALVLALLMPMLAELVDLEDDPGSDEVTDTSGVGTASTTGAPRPAT